MFRPRAVTPKSTWRRSVGWIVVGDSGVKSSEGVPVEEIFQAFSSMIETEGWNQVV